MAVRIKWISTRILSNMSNLKPALIGLSGIVCGVILLVMTIIFLLYRLMDNGPQPSESPHTSPMIRVSGVVSSTFLDDSLINETNGTEYMVEPRPTHAKLLQPDESTLEWVNSRLPAVVVSSFTIIICIAQILTSSLFCIVTKELYQRYVAVLWIGVHLSIFLVTVLLFIFTLFVQTIRRKCSTNVIEYQFNTKQDFINNPVGHTFCGILVFNAMFTLIGTIFVVDLIRSSMLVPQSNEESSTQPLPKEPIPSSSTQ